MRTLMKIPLTKICIIFVSVGLLTILLSEMMVYLNLLSEGFISGPQKTLLFAWILFWSLVEIMQNCEKLNKSYTVFFAFTVVTLCSTAIGVEQDISILRQMIHITVFFSVFTAFYIGTKQLGKEPPIRLVKFAYLVVALVYVYGKFVNRSDEGSANVIYYVLMFLPITVLIETNIIRKVSYIFQILAVLQSNKRTALIALLIYFVFIEIQTNRNISGQKLVLKIIVYCVGLLAIWFSFPYVISLLDVTVFDELSLGSVQHDGGSNRFYIYKQLWNVQKNSGFFHWIIGDGYNSVLLSKICTDGLNGGNVSAHDDFLEVLYDYGLIGITLYGSFFFCLFKNGVKASKEMDYKIPFFCSIMMVLTISVTSHLIIYLNYYALMFAFWGICLAVADKQQYALKR